MRRSTLSRSSDSRIDPFSSIARGGPDLLVLRARDGELRSISAPSFTPPPIWLIPLLSLFSVASALLLVLRPVQRKLTRLEEVAEAIGVSLSAVKVRAHRAYKQMRVFLMEGA